MNDYYQRTQTRPPGGWVQFGFEPVVRAARGAPRFAGSRRFDFGVRRVCKNAGWNYPWFNPARMAILPFGASEKDFAALGDYRPPVPLVHFGDGNHHHVYTGRSGADMADALTVLFRAFRRFREAEPGTGGAHALSFYRHRLRPPAIRRGFRDPLARAEGVGDVVREHRYRVPYFDALYYLRHAHALIAVGSNDPTYSASKIFPYMLARRPMLIFFTCTVRC